MISAGLEGRVPPYMTYPEPWRGPLKQPPELFLRPAPKPLPSTTRYNGAEVSPYSNGSRSIPPPSRQSTKYPSSPTILNPVNLAQAAKEDAPEEMSPYGGAYRLFPPTQYHFPYTLCQPTNVPTYLMRANFPPTPVSPIETFPSPAATFRAPAEAPALSPPGLKTGKVAVHGPSFKVPGKEGSLKHRILTRPDDAKASPLDLQKPPEGRKRLQASISPPRSPRKLPANNNNNVLPLNFTKGSLIQLHNGELRRIEEMRTEDFITSAERSAELRLAESTVVKIDEHPQLGNSVITLSYNNRRAQAEVESSLEHPYFVVGQGWASCSPDRTQRLFGLKVHRLQVGDVLVSLTPREWTPPAASRASATIITTATRTSMTARPQHTTKTQPPEPKPSIQTQPMNLHLSSKYPSRPVSPESAAARKRRWSAPDQICDEEDQAEGGRRQRLE
ncbi:unnamed protein product [Phyllotreta striolata]|uniref:AXH domain-containing protein n=1 Tax=Phyllotreta striolata TaxID=444603 RepID=A0A9N9TKT4_PHYSR|nr:unnamed protein product [Phyllotreta striolata]